ncbi:MAG: helix-turn-helix transcriptional regulator [Clostridia bacterium]|nr:helix-turn-helix transcriptional regulator [Clostridia bacterium]
MIFYEEKNSASAEHATIEIRQNFNFPLHFHDSFEFITVVDGELTVSVDKSIYTVTPQNALLIFPNQVHSLQTHSYSHHILCIFPARMVKVFFNTTGGKLPTSALFFPDRFYVDQLFALGENASLTHTQEKGLLYSLCAEFEKKAKYEQTAHHSETLLRQIFSFVESNFDKDCSLTALSRHTSYHEMYLSRYFKQCTGITYTHHVNHYRVNEAMHMIRNENKKLTDIAFACGFGSVRNFNRKFKEVVGVTPNEFREKRSISQQPYKSNLQKCHHGIES